MTIHIKIWFLLLIPKLSSRQHLVGFLAKHIKSEHPVHATLPIVKLLQILY